jgi:hypothetical protein
MEAVVSRLTISPLMMLNDANPDRPNRIPTAPAAEPQRGRGQGRKRKPYPSSPRYMRPLNGAFDNAVR